VAVSGVYGRTRRSLVWHLLYEDGGLLALCGLGAMREQAWDAVVDTLPDTELVCANCVRVDERGNPRP
jgi:hypothetical protein